MQIPLWFALGLFFGAVVVYVVLRRKESRPIRVGEQEVAPQVLSLEASRAKRMGYSLALVLMKPPVRNYREFHEWLETKSTDLRLRDYDVVLQWSNDEILVILPGVDQDLTHDRLRERFRDLLNRNNWQEVPFGVLVSQGDDLTPDQIAHLLRDDMQIHDMGNQDS